MSLYEENFANLLKTYRLLLAPVHSNFKKDAHFTLLCS